MSTVILTKAISELIYNKNLVFVDTVLQGTLEIEKSQDNFFYIEKQKFKTTLEVIIYCGEVVKIRVFDVDTEEETDIYELPK